MPQLDISSFTTQILWLITIYFIFYFFLLKFILPEISRIMKMRSLFLKSLEVSHPSTSKSSSSALFTKISDLHRVSIDRYFQLYQERNRTIDAWNEDVRDALESIRIKIELIK